MKNKKGQIGAVILVCFLFLAGIYFTVYFMSEGEEQNKNNYFTEICNLYNGTILEKNCMNITIFDDNVTVKIEILFNKYNLVAVGKDYRNKTRWMLNKEIKTGEI